MIYLEKFTLPTQEDEDAVMTFAHLLYGTCYPFQLFSLKDLFEVDFKEITIFYGGNGSGKSTLLNVITSKIGIKSISKYNTSELFPEFLKHCDYRCGIDEDNDKLFIPNGSRRISSDDVFDFMLLNRDNNNEMVENGKDAALEYGRLTEIKGKRLVDLRTLPGYEEKHQMLRYKRMAKKEYILKKAGKTMSSGSNGETALNFFNNIMENDKLYLLDEPENSLSPENQIKLSKILFDSAKNCGCQLIIATHSPFILSIPNAKIYNLDACPVTIEKWWELENVKIYYEFFNKYKEKFEK